MTAPTRPARVPYDEVAEIVKANPTRYTPILVEKYGIPPTTAHRWAYQARLRGHLAANSERPCKTCGGTGIVRYGPHT